MARARKTQTKVCSVSGIETNTNNFYANQIHVRRNTNASKDQLQRMFNQLNSYV